MERYYSIQYNGKIIVDDSRVDDLVKWYQETFDAKGKIDDVLQYIASGQSNVDEMAERFGVYMKGYDGDCLIWEVD